MMSSFFTETYIVAPYLKRLTETFIMKNCNDANFHSDSSVEGPKHILWQNAVVLLLYIHSKQLWSCRNGPLT